MAAPPPVRIDAAAARSASPGLADATSRIGPLAMLPQTLRDLGFEPSAVLDGTGFDPTYFTDADLPMQYRAGSRLLRHCAHATGCEHIGLLLGARVDAQVLGLPGLLLMNAGDVGTGLRELAHYMGLHDRGAVVTLEERGDAALLGYAIVAAVDERDQLDDMAMAAACNLMRSLCGADWNPSEVLLTRRPPTNPLAWDRFFRSPVRFGSGSCGMGFPSHWLRLSLPVANPMLHKLLKQEADRLHAALGTGLADELRRMVRATVANPPCTAARVARLLGLNERTLHRRLQMQGANFRGLRDEVLYEVARQVLGATSMRLNDVAASLGYAEDSAFIRAFTRWSGQTPDRWRRENARPGVLDTAMSTR